MAEMATSRAGFQRWLVGIAMLILVAGLVGCQAYEVKGTRYPEGREAADFELMAPNGQPYRLADHRGQIVLLFFGYTSCPDICPTTLAEAKQVMEGLGDEAAQVTFLFITVDPERDTPERLASYTAAFHPAIVGLTGDPDTLAAARDAYGVVAEREAMPDSALGYVVNHTARVFLVDQAGQLALSYRYGTPPGDIVADLRHLLKS